MTVHVIPFEPHIAGRTINIHLIFEYAAFFIAFRYYLWLRKRTADPIATSSRLSIILGAAVGAFLGSRIMAFLENPQISELDILDFYNLKTIMGGLFGGATRRGDHKMDDKRKAFVGRPLHAADHSRHLYRKDGLLSRWNK